MAGTKTLKTWHVMLVLSLLPVSIWERCLLMEDTLGDAMDGTPGPVCTLPFGLISTFMA